MEFEIRCKNCEMIQKFEVEYTNESIDIECKDCGSMLVEDFKVIANEK